MKPEKDYLCIKCGAFLGKTYGRDQCIGKCTTAVPVMLSGKSTPLDVSHGMTMGEVAAMIDADADPSVIGQEYVEPTYEPLSAPQETGVYFSSPTNSTFFTTCCRTAVGSEQEKCPKCEAPIIGHDAPWEDRHGIRWASASAASGF